MKQRLFLHIGFPKTASSTIQAYCNRNRDLLKSRGIYYPVPQVGGRTIGHEGHNCMVENCAKYFFDVKPWYAYRDDYLESLKKTGMRINILSAESMVFDHPRNFYSFKEFFDVKIICFFRSIFDLIASARRQVTKEWFRDDFFSNLPRRNFTVLGFIEEYIHYFGLENCYFLDFNKIREESDVVTEFFKIMDVEIPADAIQECKSNVTPSDVVTMFLYQIAFFPLNFKELDLIRYQLLTMDLSKWKKFRCSIIPNAAFRIDEEFKKSIRRQGELLNDPSWYEKTFAKMKFFSSLGSKSLPVEIQYDIWEKFTPEVRSILMRYCKPAADKSISFLPSIADISQYSFDLLVNLRRKYIFYLGNSFRLQNKLNELTSQIDFSNKDVDMKRISIFFSSSSHFNQKNIFTDMFSLFFLSLFNLKYRQIAVIIRSGVFDSRWYLEKNRDVAESQMEPIRHYVLYGAGEGRDPAPWFSTSAYLLANPDVQKKGLNPFYHYIRFGFNEGRKLC